MLGFLRHILRWQNHVKAKIACAAAKILQKIIKLLLDKQIFASSDVRFCCDMRNDDHYMQNFIRNTRNFSYNFAWNLSFQFPRD